MIYRFQVLKQADVVLALFLQGDHFTAEEKRADFEYYDPITTGDSTLSAVVQSIIAAEVGYHDAGAATTSSQALFVDLADLHDNTVDGAARRLHRRRVERAGLRLRRHARPRRPAARSTRGCPTAGSRLTFRITWRGTRVRVTLTASELRLEVEAGRAAGADRGARRRATPSTRTSPSSWPSTGTARAAPAPSATGRRPVAPGPTAAGSRPGVPDPMPAADTDLLDPTVLESTMPEPSITAPD